MKYFLHNCCCTLLSIMMLVGFPSEARAQISHTSTGATDTKASAALAKAASVFEKNNVSFTVTMVNFDEKKKETARTTAQVIYSKGRYRATAPDQVLYGDGKTVWHWNKEVGEVVVNPVGEDETDLLNPASLLRSYEKNFRAKYIRSESDGSAVIDLQPRSSKSYHKLRLLIDEKNGSLRRLEIHNFDGSRGEYRLADFNMHARCKDADFLFDAKAHPDVEVIDMR